MTSPRLEAVPTTLTRPARRPRAAAPDPAHDGSVFESGYHAAPAGRPGPLPRDLVGVTVVVVDDDADTLEYFEAALRACGAAVLTAATAPDALRLVGERRPDVVLSDIAMPGHDGYWLVDQIRGSADSGARRIPVVATTAYGREHSRERALASGFSEHLPKPVEPEQLCRTIARLARR